MDRPRDRLFSASSLLALALSVVTGLACGDDSDCGGQDGEITPRCSIAVTSTATATDSATDSATGSTTESTSDSESGVDTEGSASTGQPNLCEVNAVGEWNACKQGPLIDNSKCNWEDNGTAGEVTCISPSSGGGNICSIEQCEDECDCFAPPATGTAPVICAPVLNDNAKGCVLDCGSGQTCPDSMACISGYCYWPKESP
jgi:hypothetical protein